MDSVCFVDGSVFSRLNSNEKNGFSMSFSFRLSKLASRVGG